MNCLQAVGKKAALATPAFKGDGFVKSPSAIRQAVRQAHGPEQGRRTHGPEQSRRAALRFIPRPVKLKAAISRDMGYRSCLKTAPSEKENI
jgi:hypothetical protein